MAQMVLRFAYHVTTRDMTRGRVMTAHRLLTLLAAVSIPGALCASIRAEAPPTAAITNVNAAGQQLNLQFTLYPGAQTYTILSAPDLNSPFLPDPNFLLTPHNLTNYLTNVVNGSNVVTTNIQALYEWRRTNNTTPDCFYRLEVVPMDSSGLPQSTNSLLTATVLNRLAYGPTPDELERVRAIGPDAYIDEQMKPESIIDNLPFETITTNFGSGWQQFTATGTANTSGTGTNFYLYLNTPGDCFIDDIRVVAGASPGVGVNLIRNGDFEAPLSTNDWIVSPNHAASAITTAARHSGTASLHMVASVGGTTQGSAIWQPVIGLANGATYTLSYWFLPSTNNQLSSLTVRFSGSWISSAPYPVSAYTTLITGSGSIDELRGWHVQRGVQSRRQLLEVLDQFLENHFVTQYSKSSEYFSNYYNDGNKTAQLATQLEFKENQRWRQALMNPQCTFYDLLRIS